MYILYYCNDYLSLLNWLHDDNDFQSQSLGRFYFLNFISMLKIILVFVSLIFPLSTYSAITLNTDIEEKYFTPTFVSQMKSLYPWIEKKGNAVSNSNKSSRSIWLNFKTSKLPNSVLDIRVSLYSDSSTPEKIFKDNSSQYSSQISYDWKWLPVVRVGNSKGFDLVKEITTKANPKYINTSWRSPGKWRNAIYFIKNKVVVEIMYSPEFTKKNIYIIGKNIFGINSK